MSKQYNPWPLGKLPESFQRKEIDLLKEAGYNVDDPRDAVTIFENKIAAYAGSKYAVAVDSCTDAIFLSLKYLKATEQITFPSRTYVSAPMAAILAGCDIKFVDYEWSGIHYLDPYPIVDSAVRFTKDMYEKCIENGYNPNKVVLGMFSGQFDSTNFVSCLDTIIEICEKYKNFGGVFVWEYIDAPPSRNPADWAILINAVMKK